MYKLSETTDRAEMTRSAPFGPGFHEVIVAQAAKMEVWGSSFKDDGKDYCEFRLFNAAGDQIGAKVVDGY